MNRVLKTLLLILSLILLMSSCSTKKEEISNNNETTPTVETTLDIDITRPSFINNKDIYVSNIIPNLNEKKVSDLTLLLNWDLIGDIFDETQITKLQKDGFVVKESYDDEFFSIYETNRYSQLSNYVTVDSLMHTYHLFFIKLLRTIETDIFYSDLIDISKYMYDQSLSDYELYKGSSFEEGALKNVIFYGVASNLIGGNTNFPDYAKDVINTELQYINNADGIASSPLLLIGVVNELEAMEDYSQYKPRGSYTRTEILQSYFKTMMWYGRIGFKANEETGTKSALLTTLNINSNQDILDKWEKIYSITSFFVGASDDPGIYEYSKLIKNAYGNLPEKSNLVNDTNSFDKYFELVKNIEMPAINSIPVLSSDLDPKAKESIPGFRFMGQRYVLDAEIFQNLVENKVEDRYLPSSLDITTALGNEISESILKNNLTFDYVNYSKQMEKMKEKVSLIDNTIWNSTLYNSWLNTLNPLNENTNKDGYPMHMQSDAWQLKKLVTFLGSWTELKHDTVLYAKQVMAEMGGAGQEDYDDRGYVEAEPAVFARLASLCDSTIEGLKNFNALTENDEENLEILSSLATKLKIIAEKELMGELPTDEEFGLIRNYGGYLEHLWIKSLEDINPNISISDLSENSSLLVTDIATDPNGLVLEVGTGHPETIYVIVYVDGIPKIASGTIFSFYEFVQPISKRLTDEEWKEMLECKYNQTTNQCENEIKKPDWVSSLYQ